MGYTTHADCDLIGLGVSAISHIGDSFSWIWNVCFTIFFSLETKAYLKACLKCKMNRFYVADLSGTVEIKSGNRRQALRLPLSE